jgi:hypothetical protein
MEDPTQASSSIMGSGRNLGTFEDRQSFREAALRLDRRYLNGSQAGFWMMSSALSQKVTLRTPSAFDLGLNDTIQLDGLQAIARGSVAIDTLMFGLDSEMRMSREFSIQSNLSYGFLDPNITYSGELRQFLLGIGTKVNVLTDPFQLASLRLGAVYRRGPWELEAQVLQAVAFNLSESESDSSNLRGRSPAAPSSRVVEDGGRTVQFRVGWRF